MCPPPENQSRFQGLAAHFFAFVKAFFFLLEFIG
jgi:hypothetical protein